MINGDTMHYLLHLSTTIRQTVGVEDNAFITAVYNERGWPNYIRHVPFQIEIMEREREYIGNILHV